MGHLTVLLVDLTSNGDEMNFGVEDVKINNLQ